MVTVFILACFYFVERIPMRATAFRSLRGFLPSYPNSIIEHVSNALMLHIKRLEGDHGMSTCALSSGKEKVASTWDSVPNRSCTPGIL